MRKRRWRHEDEPTNMTFIEDLLLGAAVVVLLFIGFCL